MAANAAVRRGTRLKLGFPKTRSGYFSRMAVYCAMPLAAGEITRDDVIVYAAERGVRITKDQLIRWHRNGLLPRPRQFSKGKKRGTASAYLAVAAPLAVFLASVKVQRRNLDHMAWLAWSAGYPLTPRLRSLLIARYRTQVQSAADGLEAFDQEEAGNPIDAASEDPVPQGMGRIPRDLRPTLVRMGLEATAGLFAPQQYVSSDFDRLFLRKQRRKKKLKSTEWQGVLLKDTFGALDATRALDAAERLSDAQLEADRELAHLVWRHVFATVPGPLMFGVFEVVFMVRHVSPRLRWFIQVAKREARTQGFTTLGSFYDYLRSTHAAQAASSGLSDVSLSLIPSS